MATGRKGAPMGNKNAAGNHLGHGRFTGVKMVGGAGGLGALAGIASVKSAVPIALGTKLALGPTMGGALLGSMAPMTATGTLLGGIAGAHAGQIAAMGLLKGAAVTGGVAGLAAGGTALAGYQAYKHYKGSKK
jgi:hypothetical protein